MSQSNNAIQATLLHSLTKADSGAFSHIREILTLGELFEKCVVMNQAMKTGIEKSMPAADQDEYKLHMGAMLIAMRDSVGSPKKSEIMLAAGIERLKALDILAGAALRAFPPQTLALYTPAEFEKPEYLSEINGLGLKNIGQLALCKP